MNHYISTQAIMNAMFFYQSKGFEPIKVPLLVDCAVSDITKPKNVPNLHHSNNKVYVASAEQSFLQLLEHDLILDADNIMYQGITPCYRPERYLDDEHYLIFLKLELFAFGNVIDKVLSAAKAFYDKEGLDTEVIATPEGYDIVCKYTNLELGSYGIRKSINGTVYTYGTGIADPRFSHCYEIQHYVVYKD